MRARLIPLLAAALLVSACARGLTPEQCVAADWRAIGLADGSAGHGPDRLAEHRAACAEAGVPDARQAAEWEAGRQQGLLAYCTPRNAYRIGLSGRAMAPVCPAEMAAELEAINETGWRDGIELRQPYLAYPPFGFPYYSRFGYFGGHPGWGYPGWGFPPRRPISRSDR